MYKEIQKKFKIEKLGTLKNHLGIWCEWKNDKITKELYLEDSMPKLIEEFIIATGKEAKRSIVPATPGKCLRKNKGQTVVLDEYRSLVGKIMYHTTKRAPELSNAARELASHLSNPGEKHCYLKYGKNLSLIYRKPSELRSISTC
jgi:hypothetical protein